MFWSHTEISNNYKKEKFLEIKAKEQANEWLKTIKSEKF
jgi:hypothetical protein